MTPVARRIRGDVQILRARYEEAYEMEILGMSPVKQASRNETRRCFQLNFAEDNRLANALRVCEAIFSEDVLPCHAELMAPSDFYAAIASGPSRTRPTAKDEELTLLPFLAA
ncbi:hypothetical protein [Bradyrhizobium sp. BR 10261]|uniref:hypothetical protein n=1 Tax=Bradyrhizobium sp. BR 10261 TaxID=2749992 RepID=UPI001C6526C9|nr:hypothetical protein [Bradyrhizobium sp. BR 10261]MBW7961413.1 hypothetical protein [Bradyrhizobium sp. BR 10261]